MAMIFMFRSVFGYEEINPNKVLDRTVLSLLWLNLALSFLEDVFKKPLVLHVALKSATVH